MNKTVYVCSGTCQAEVSQEQYKQGITTCQANECTKHAQPFEKRQKCDVCGTLSKPSEQHEH